MMRGQLEAGPGLSVAADLRESLDEILSEVGIEGVSIDLLLALTAHSTPHLLPPTPLPHSRHLRHSHRAPQVEIVSSLPVPLDAVRNGHNRSSPPGSTEEISWYAAMAHVCSQSGALADHGL